MRLEQLEDNNDLSGENSLYPPPLHHQHRHSHPIALGNRSSVCHETAAVRFYPSQCLALFKFTANRELHRAKGVSPHRDQIALIGSINRTYAEALSWLHRGANKFALSRLFPQSSLP